MDELNRWCENEGLEWNKDDKTAIGFVNGYPFLVQSQEKEYFLCAFCSDKIKTQDKQNNTEFSTASGMLCSLLPHQSGPGIMQLTSATQRLCNKAVRDGLLPSACRECGGGEHLRVWKKADDYTVLCIDCRDKLEKYEKTKNAPNTAPRSENVLGALIGAFLALIIYVIVYQLGNNMSAPLGAITGFIIARGCLKDKNVFTKRSAMMCVQIGVFTLITAQLFAVTLTLYLSYFWQGISLLDAFKMLPAFMTTAGVMRTALQELLFAAAPMALIVFWWYIRIKKRNKK